MYSIQSFNPIRISLLFCWAGLTLFFLLILNKGIPDIFNSLGIKSFYQDMIPSDEIDLEDIAVLLKTVPWYFVSRILGTARIIAETRNLYPVLITAFKCAPDSFIIEYFKKIFDSCHKPYLILQIDEHDSNLGYETRIEAAMRSFRNHSAISDTKPGLDRNRFFLRYQGKLQARHCFSRHGIRSLHHYWLPILKE